MKVAFISYDGSGADTAWRLEQEGHEVRFYVVHEDYQDTYLGILKTPCKTWEEAAKGADYAFFDSTKMGDIWKKLPKDLPKFGGSPFADEVEHDRVKGHAIMKAAKLDTIESLSFPDYDAAIKHVLEHKVKHVCKPHGPEIESEHIIIGEMESGEDAAALLNRMKEQGLKLDQPIEVEEKKDGIECAVSVFLNGRSIIGLCFVNFETKRFASGNMGDGTGFLTGEMGETAKWVSPEQTALFKEGIEKVLPAFIKEDYRGILDISFIANDDGFFPLEFTPRPGYPPIFLMTALQKTPLGELFYACAKGEEFKNDASPDWAIGVSVVTPGFPSFEMAEKKSVGLPIFGVSNKNRKNVHFFEAMLGKVNDKPGLVTSKGIGYPFVITATGPTLLTAQKRIYRLANQTARTPDGKHLNPSVNNSSYRDDIGRRVLERQDEIIQLGILPSEAFTHA